MAETFAGAMPDLRESCCIVLLSNRKGFSRLYGWPAVVSVSGCLAVAALHLAVELHNILLPVLLNEKEVFAVTDGRRVRK